MDKINEKLPSKIDPKLLDKDNKEKKK